MRKYIIIAAALCLCVCGCNKIDEPEEPEQAPFFILDTDLGGGVDDMFAMSVLYNHMREGKCEFKAIMLGREGKAAARLADIFNTYYGDPLLPIGVSHGGPADLPADVDYWKMGLPESYPDEPRFPRSLSDEEIANLPPAEDLYCKILSEAKDSSVYIVATGFTTNLSHLLQSSSDLVSKKVVALYIQAGHFDFNPEPDANFALDIDNAKRVVSSWPTPIYFIPSENSEWLSYEPDKVLRDFESRDMTDSPIYHAFAHHAVAKGTKMIDPLCVLDILYPDMFINKGPYLYSVDDKGVLVKETPSALNPPRHYMVEPQSNISVDVMVDLIRKYATARP